MTWASQQDKRKVDKLVDFRYDLLSRLHSGGTSLIQIREVVHELDKILALDKELERKV